MEADGLQGTLDALVTTLRVTLRTELTSIWLPIQFGIIVLAALAAWGCAAAIRRRFDLVTATMGWPSYLRIFVRALIDNFGVLAFMVLIGITRTAIRTWAAHPRTYILGVAGDLATAWVVIALAASLIRNPFINRVVQVTAWTIAALSILGLLDDTVAALDARAILIGGIRVTPLLVLKTAVLLAVALWAATATSNFLDRRVQHVSGLTPSIQVLAGKLIRIGVMTAAIVIVLSASGIDLSVLAVFTGAIGVGVGLGLQKIVSTSSAASFCWPTSRSSRATSSRSAIISAGSRTWARATPRSISRTAASCWCRTRTSSPSASSTGPIRPT